MEKDKSNTPIEINELERIVKEIMQKLSSTTLPESGKKIYFPWDDVLNSMVKYHERVSCSNDVCPECGRNCLRIYFSSPDWTWQQLCGRAGTMVICNHCPKQIDFRLEIMN